jgi:hypothetical protein
MTALDLNIGGGILFKLCIKCSDFSINEELRLRRGRLDRVSGVAFALLVLVLLQDLGFVILRQSGIDSMWLLKGDHVMSRWTRNRNATNSGDGVT